MYWQTVAAASLLATGVQASIGSLIVEGMSRDSPAYHRRMEEIAKRSLELRSILRSRQDVDTSSNAILNADGTINMTAWDLQATQACAVALSHLPEASNPSGTCICYNLPALDDQTGAFEADLRLYQLSTPSGQFAGIPGQKIQVGLSYSGASVSPVSAQTASQKVVTAPQIVARQDASITDNITEINPDLKLLQTYLFVGQVDKSQMSSTMSMAQLEALVMPVVTLSGVSPSGQTVSTNVSSNEAAFVAGVFSQSIVLSNVAIAQVAVNDAVERLQNGTDAFVLPGTQILIFPIGLVVTGIWTVLGVAAYVAGTIARIRFADQYKRRTQMMSKGGVSRI